VHRYIVRAVIIIGGLRESGPGQENDGDTDNDETHEVAHEPAPGKLPRRLPFPGVRDHEHGRSLTTADGRAVLSAS
jgi:hypothetical protein